MDKRRASTHTPGSGRLLRWLRWAGLALAAIAIAIPVVLVGVHPRGGMSGTLVLTDETGRSQTVAEWRTGTDGGESITVTPGEVHIEVSNADAEMHDLVVVRTEPRGIARIAPDGSVDLASLGAVVAAIPGFPPGDSRSETVTLEQGEYIILCSLPGHYEAGMYYRVEAEG